MCNYLMYIYSSDRQRSTSPELTHASTDCDMERNPAYTVTNVQKSSIHSYY